MALVGDAAHAMPGTRGEGANTALESAAALDAELGAAAAAAAAAGGGPGLSAVAVSEAFRRYGAARPAAVRDVVLQSAGAARWRRGGAGK